MKSEKAKQFLETKHPGDIAQYEVSLWKANKAVEIAEVVLLIRLKNWLCFVNSAEVLELDKMDIMEVDDEIERSRNDLWLVITDGRDVVHYEVEDYAHANRIVDDVLFGGRKDKFPAPEPYPLFTAEDVPDGTRVCGVEFNGDVIPGLEGHLGIYLMNDRQRHAYLTWNTEEKMKQCLM